MKTPIVVVCGTALLVLSLQSDSRSAARTVPAQTGGSGSNRGAAEPAGKRPKTDGGAVNRWLDTLTKQMGDSTLDNPSDSTTKRADILSVAAGFPPSSSHVRTRLTALLLDRLAHDTYPRVRYVAAQALTTLPFRSRSGDSALVAALHDPSMMVSSTAAGHLVATGLADSTAARVAWQTAAGMDMSRWNVRGFFARADQANTPGLVDSLRAGMQYRALASICYSNGEMAAALLDSITQKGSSVQIRAHAKNCLSQRTGAKRSQAPPWQ